MSGLAKYFGKVAEVAGQKGAKVAISSLAAEKKIVFFYFSASWCPPCRGFTPQLAEFYEAHAAEKKFEVVFVSWDEEEEDFDGYFAKMPWTAIPFANKEERDALTKHFSVESIPTLIGVDAATGDVITTTARAKVPQDPEGKGFPWPDKE